MEPKRPYRALIGKSLRRHWLLILAACVYFFLFDFFRINNLVDDLKNIPSYLEAYSRNYLADLPSHWRKKLYTLDIGVFEFFLGAVAAVYAFSHLHKKQENHFYHSLPLRKSTLFFTSLASGFLIYALPWLVTTLITTPIVYSVWDGNKLFWGVYFQNMVFRLALYGIAYSMSVLVAVLCGRRFFALLLTVFSFFLPFLLEEYFNLILGKSPMDYALEIFCPIVYLPENFHWSPSPPWGAVGIYVALSPGLLFLASFLYRKRKEEQVEQNLAFPSLSLLMEYLFTMLLSFTVASWLVNLELLPKEDSSLAFPCLILSPVAFFLSRMLLLRKMKVFQKKAFLHWGIYALCFLSAILIFQFDILKIARKVPKPETVTRLTLTLNGMTFTTEDPQDIADFTQVHRLIVKDRDLLTQEKKDPSHRIYYSPSGRYTEDSSYCVSFTNLEILYEREGKDLSRSYTIPSNRFAPIWDALDTYFREGFRDTQQLLYLYNDADTVAISQRLWEGDPDTLDGPRYMLSTAQKKALFSALLADIEAGGKPIALQNEGLYGIEITVKTGEDTTLRFHPHKSLKNTCALLNSILDEYETAE